MKLYCRGDIVVATHFDYQSVDPALYGDEVSIQQVPDDFSLERRGDPPKDGHPDPRPWARPAVDPESGP